MSSAIVDYGPPLPGQPSGFQAGCRKGVRHDPTFDLWSAWMSQDNTTFSFGPFETEAEAREALAHPERWSRDEDAPGRNPGRAR
jgi:hypothetical protein